MKALPNPVTLQRAENCKVRPGYSPRQIYSTQRLCKTFRRGAEFLDPNLDGWDVVDEVS